MDWRSLFLICPRRDTPLCKAARAAWSQLEVGLVGQRARNRRRPESGRDAAEGVGGKAWLVVTGVPVHGELNQLRRRVQVELLLDALAVRFHRLDGEIQRSRNLPSGLAPSDEVQH